MQLSVCKILVYSYSDIYLFTTLVFILQIICNIYIKMLYVYYIGVSKLRKQILSVKAALPS